MDKVKKPKWVVAKEQAKKVEAATTVWLFGLHAVRDALMNPKREKLRLIVTLNAHNKLVEAIAEAGIDAITELQGMGYLVLGLDGDAEQTIEAAVAGRTGDPVALVLGAEGPGLREKTKETCDALVRIDASGGFGSLNVSNAAALALYATKARS